MASTRLAAGPEIEVEEPRARDLALLVNAPNRMAAIEEAGFDVGGRRVERGPALAERVSPDVVVVGTGESLVGGAGARVRPRPPDRDPGAVIPAVVRRMAGPAVVIELRPRRRAPTPGSMERDGLEEALPW
jgi:hypothetical protein